jgi:predicted nucleic acid-binding protein
MNAIDTNIWIYRYDVRDPAKQRTAEQLILIVRPLVLFWQVGCEFIAASRKLAPTGFSEDDAWAALTYIQSISSSIAYPNVRSWPKTQDLQKRFSLSFWDALLVASCILGGVQTLYTENMGAPRVIDGLSLVNPFLAGP